jgi:2-C-methyl-D-erythritol 4-phosphate cytidylyltransferase
MNVAIIAAAGQGKRMGGIQAKQFLELAGTPIILHTLRPFEHCDVIQEIILVLPAQETAGFLGIAKKSGLRKLSKIVPGGRTRAESVLKGLLAVRPATAEIIAVHDGVRPFITSGEISETVEAAKSSGAAILVAPATDTIKEVDRGVVVKTHARSQVRRALTPQCFRYELLRRAYNEVDVMDPELTDDSTLVERLGVEVATVEGSSRNIKITGPEDLAVAEALLESGLWS